MHNSLSPQLAGRNVLLSTTCASTVQGQPAEGTGANSRAVPDTDHFRGWLGSTRLLPLLPLVVWDTSFVATSMSLLRASSVFPTQRPKECEYKFNSISKVLLPPNQTLERFLDMMLE